MLNALEILIADDDESVCAALEAELAARGLNALSVTSLELARQAMRAIHFPVVVVDRDLGGGDAGALCREIRARHGDRRIHVLMLSATDTAAEAEFASSVGADEFISKRRGFAAILERICQVHAAACGRVPPTADNEAAGQRILDEYAFADAASEPAFDDITHLAATLCRTPMAALSFVDGMRLRFKSQVGFAVEAMALGQSFCAHALRQPDRVLVVADSQQDDRFVASPLVSDEPSIRFYAGAPLVIGDGRVLGALCVFGTQPRELSVAEQQGLSALARQVVRLLEHRKEQARAQRALDTQRQAEQQWRQRAALLRDAYEHAPIGKALVSTDGQWLQVNHAICDMLGYSTQELLRTNFQTITHPADLEADLHLLHQMLAGAISSYEMDKRYIRKDGRIVWALLTVSLVRDEHSEPVFFISEVQDITQRKLRERSRNEFFSMFHHELRMPVSTLKGVLARLRDQVSATVPSNAASLMDLGARCVARLQRLVEHNADYQVVEAGTFRYEPTLIDADDLLSLAVEEMQFFASDSNVQLEKSSSRRGLRIAVDQDRMLQVLTNLIGKAVRVSPPGQRVRVSAKRWNSKVRVSIRDFGPAIGNELRAQLARDAQLSEGAGLGLRVCKAIVQGHQGLLSYRTGPSGTNFYFELPLAHTA